MHRHTHTKAQLQVYIQYMYTCTSKVCTRMQKLMYAVKNTDICTCTYKNAHTAPTQSAAQICDSETDRDAMMRECGEEEED